MGGNGKHSRRGFLQGAAAATVTASIGGVGTYAWLRDTDPGPSSRTLTADELEYELFEPIVGDELAIGRARGVVSSVTDRTDYLSADGISGTSFSVIIESADLIEQGTHDFRHRTIGTFPMFVAPVGRPSSGSNTYEAAFNRLT